MESWIGLREFRNDPAAPDAFEVTDDTRVDRSATVYPINMYLLHNPRSVTAPGRWHEIPSSHNILMICTINCTPDKRLVNRLSTTTDYRRGDWKLPSTFLLHKLVCAYFSREYSTSICSHENWSNGEKLTQDKLLQVSQ